jgi:hypothetical protein
MKARPFPEGCIESLKAELKRARAEGVPALERVLCVWLRAALGLRAAQVATAIGWSVDGVRHFQARYLKEGEALFRRPGRGGDRRHSSSAILLHINWASRLGCSQAYGLRAPEDLGPGAYRALPRLPAIWQLRACSCQSQDQAR